MMGEYLGWVRLHGGWQVVCMGKTPTECMRLLLDWIRAQPKPPVASAVRPAGQRPDAREARQGTPALPDSPEAVRVNGEATGKHRRQKGG
jgi:hypothetical protein